MPENALDNQIVIHNTAEFQIWVTIFNFQNFLRH